MQFLTTILAKKMNYFDKVLYKISNEAIAENKLPYEKTLVKRLLAKKHIFYDLNLMYS